MPVLRFLIILLLLFNLLALAAWRGWLGEGNTGGEPERITNQLRPERIHLLSQAELAGDAAAPAGEAPSADAPAVAAAVETPAKPNPSPQPKPAKPPEAVAPIETVPQAEAPEPKPDSPARAEPPAPDPAKVDAATPATPEPAVPAPAVAQAPPAAETPQPVKPPPPSPAASVVAPPPPACVAFAGLADEAARPLLEDARARRDFETRDIVSTEIDAWWVILPSLGGMAAAQKRSAELRAMGVTEQYIIPERGSHPYGISLGLFRSVESANEQRQELMARGLDNIEIEERGITTHRVEVRGPSDRLSEWASRWTSRQPRGSRLSCRP